MQTRRGFTLMELLVVIAIILILVSMLLPILAAVGKTKIRAQAQKQVADIANACKSYYDELKHYPPDTDAFTTGTIADNATAVANESIWRYLSLPVTDTRSGRTYGPYLIIRPEQLKVVGATRIYVDPWGQPYHMDCVHTILTDPADPGSIKRVGEPYPPGWPENKKLLDVKVWSSGPDMKEVNGSYEDGPPYADPANADNVMSWNGN